MYNLIFDDMNFIKKGWINRKNILLDGKKHMWTLPLSNTSQNRLDIEILKPALTEIRSSPHSESFAT